MKCIFNFLVCKRRAIHTAVVRREPAILPPKIHTVTTNPMSGSFFPNTLAVAGCFAVCLGLRHLREKASSNGRSSGQQMGCIDAQEQKHLQSITPPGSNRCSVTLSPCLGIEQEQLAFQTLSPTPRSAPGLSSIVHPRAVGDSDFRSFTNLEGVDIAPKKRFRKNRRKGQKKKAPQMSEMREEESQNETLARKGLVKSHPHPENSSDVADSAVATEEQSTTRDSLNKHAEAGNQSQDVRVTAPPLPHKKPRKRLNRHRPGHSSRGQKTHQHVPLRSEGTVERAVNENNKMADLPQLEVASALTETESPSKANEVTNSSRAKYHPSRRSSFSLRTNNHRKRSDHTPHASSQMGDGKEKVHRKKAPGNYKSTTGSSSSSGNGHRQSREPYDTSSSTIRGRNDFREVCRGKIPKQTAAGDASNPMGNDAIAHYTSKNSFRGHGRGKGGQHRSEKKPYPPRIRRYPLQRKYVDLDKPQ